MLRSVNLSKVPEYVLDEQKRATMLQHEHKPELTTKPAGRSEWMDVQRALTGGGDGRSCQCCWPIMTSEQWRTSSVDERREFLHAEIDRGTTPGIVCYMDGEAVGWVRVGPRPVQHRILATRVVRTGSSERCDDTSVWAVTCFSVRREARGFGITATLLKSAVEYARLRGARMIEAYPFDNRRVRLSANELFVGALTTFLDAGFVIVSHPTPKRVVVTLRLK